MAADNSDYGEELDWDDEELETQLAAIENAPAQPHTATRPELARVEVAVEGAEPLEQQEKRSGPTESMSDALEVLENGSSATGPSLSLW